MTSATVPVADGAHNGSGKSTGAAVPASQEDQEYQRLQTLSYSQQYDELVSKPLAKVDFRKPFPKPSHFAQVDDPHSRCFPFSSVHYRRKHRYFWQNSWLTEGFACAMFMLMIHSACLLAPFTFDARVASIFCIWAPLSGFCVEMIFHRLLTHRSFKVPKWFEYAASYIGVLNNQGSPLAWVSDHRYHHLHTDTPLDPHSSYEGIWWSHIGWLFDDEALWPKDALENVTDLSSQPWYRFLDKYYWVLILSHLGMLYYFGGVPAVVWLFALKVVCVYHLTFLVNSAAHIWGTSDYVTCDLSKNSMLVAMLTLGQWHNNHHAFEHSARTGLEWWQFDLTWYMICLLELLGIATNAKQPTNREKERRKFKTSEEVKTE